MQRAAEQDPKALRASVLGLQAEVAERDRVIADQEARLAEADQRVPVFPADLGAALSAAAERIQEALGVVSASGPVSAAVRKQFAVRHAPAPKAVPAAPKPRRATPVGDVRFRAGAQRMLLRLTKAQRGTVAHMKRTGGAALSTYLGEPRRADFVVEDGVGFTLTDAGFDYLGGRPDPMTAGELHQHYLSILRAGAARMLQAVMDAYPAGLSKDELAERVEISASGGTSARIWGSCAGMVWWISVAVRLWRRTFRCTGRGLRCDWPAAGVCAGADGSSGSESASGCVGGGGRESDRVYSVKLTGTAKSTERPGLAALLDYAREGDVIVVTGIDRLDRDVAAVMLTIRDLGARGTVLRSIREGIDTSNATGRMIAGVLASLAELELE